MEIVINPNGSISLLNLNTHDSLRILDALFCFAESSKANGAEASARSIQGVYDEIAKAVNEGHRRFRQRPTDTAEGGAR